MKKLEKKQRITDVAIAYIENTIEELLEEVNTKLQGDGSTDEGGFAGNNGDYSAQSANNFLSEQAHIRRAEAEQHKEMVFAMKRYRFLNTHKKVELLTLLITNRGTFFISKPIMPLDVDGEKVFYLATDAPIYEIMAGKEKGDSFSFRNIDYKILDLY